MSAKQCTTSSMPVPADAQRRISLGALLIWVLSVWLLLVSATVTVIYKQNQAKAQLQAGSALLSQLSDISYSVALAAPDSASPARLRRLDQQFQRVVQLLNEGGMVDGVRLRPLDKPLLGLVGQIANEWQRRLSRLDFPVTPEQVLLPAATLGAEDSLFRHNTQQLLDSFESRRLSTQAKHRWTVAGLLGLNLLVLMGSYFMFRTWAAQPLDQLSAQAGAFLRGNYRAKSSAEGTSEISFLSRVLNFCGLRIQQLDAQLSIQKRSLAQVNAACRSLTHNPLLGVYISSEGRFDFVNKKLADTLGYSRSYMRQQLTLADVFLEPRFPSLSEVVPERHLGANSVRYETRAVRHDGKSIDVEVCEVPIRLEGRITTVAVVQDITMRVRNEVTGRLAAVVYDNTCEAIVVTDRFGHVVDANPAFSRITGYALDEVRGRTLAILSSGRQDSEFYRLMWLEIIETGRWQGDIWNRRKNGEEYAERLTISTAWNPDGTVYRHIGLFTDITSHKKREAQMWRQAHYDHLTGLPNRQMFQDRLQQAMEQSRRTGLPFALVFMDLDFFKDVNDSLGHEKGDVLLQEVARRLQQCVRATDTVARIGGDEFTVIISDISDPAIVERICRCMLDTIEEPFQLDNNSVSVSASIGITVYPEDGDDAGELLKNADMAMYAAKACGRNQYCRFLPAMGEAVQARLRFSQDLQNALHEQQFRLYYQPILDMETGQVLRAEALIRWEHPQLGLVPPSEFIPFSEDSGLIVAIGEWVFETAAQAVMRLRQELDPSFRISLNVSPAQFKLNGSCAQDWVEHLQGEGIPGEALVVEITERLLLDGQDQALQQLRLLREYGMGVALDDFGTGYSSLSHLKRFSINVLKIDQCYIRNLSQGSEDLVLTQAMIVMAQKLGLRVVAEGVTTYEQVELLHQAGCDYMQGYLCSPPIPAADFAQWCKDWNRDQAADFVRQRQPRIEQSA
ncbi:EAL domain-containing protein [Alcaligenes sp. SDU_A2]|uniref:EAL domain-containing protein n=1 Tax=Alcaligenes sp. SDU_A2 TaxID=3136634 RepID=UPI003120055B